MNGVLLVLFLVSINVGTGYASLDVRDQLVEERESLLEEAIATQQGKIVVPEYDFENSLGVHYSVELLNISDWDVLNSSAQLEEALIASLQEIGVESFESQGFDKFKGNGPIVSLIFTGSHVTLHSWPRHRHVSVDVYTSRHGEGELKKLVAALKLQLGAGSFFLDARIPRGIPGDTPFRQNMVQAAAAIEVFEEMTRNDEIPHTSSIAGMWASQMTEEGFDNLFSFSQGDYEDVKFFNSKFQEFEFILNRNNQDLCFFLDGEIQICSSFLHEYSEVYVHLPIAFMDTLEKVLIVGGGDALALEEVLKYKDVKRVVQLELDIMVPTTIQEMYKINAHLPDNPNRDPRVEWVFGDASVTIDDLTAAGEKFDLILMDISETDPSGTVSSTHFFEKILKVLKPQGVLIKNENYQEVMASLVTEYLEVIYPIPVIAEQTFCLGTIDLSLQFPNFRLWERNNITTAFLKHGPSDTFRQFRSMVRRYSKNGLDFKAQAQLEYDQRRGIPLTENKEKSQECPDVTMPCAEEVVEQELAVKQVDWIDECEVPPPEDEVELTFTNLSPHPLTMYWVPPGLTKVEEKDMDRKIEVVGSILPGQSRKVLSFYGDKLDFIDMAQPPQFISLAKFTVSHQHYTHPHIIFRGVQDKLVASTTNENEELLN